MAVPTPGTHVQKNLQTSPVVGLIVTHVFSGAGTFSWEPYLERTVGGGSPEEWWIDYEFGTPASAPVRTKL